MIDKKAVYSFLKNNAPNKLLQIYLANYSYLKKTCEIINKKDSKEFEVYTIAYNNDKVIDYQIKLMKKNFKDDHLHIIVDNSSDIEISKKIRKICSENDTMYIKLPENKLYCSHSHALALNYTRKNIIQKREKVKYFGFLDHDIFPIKSTSILPILVKQKMYGYLVDKNRRGYLGDWRFIWPGFCFFDKSISKFFDFRLYKKFIPFRTLDTGGKNRKYIYKNYKKEDLEFSQNELRGITEDKQDIPLNYSQIIDGAPKIENLLYYYEFIKNKERIHKGGTYFFGKSTQKSIKIMKNLQSHFSIN